LLKKLAQKKAPRKEIVIEKFVGKGIKAYYVKSLLVHGGKGKANRVSKMFRRVVENSH
jgi:hypothetical protein